MMAELRARGRMLRAAVPRVAQRLRSPQDAETTETLSRQVARLRRRVAVLEEDLQENRRLNRRIAELTDIVQELLLPVDHRRGRQGDSELLRRLDGYDKHS